LQCRQLGESGDIGAQLGHRDVFDVLEQAGLMVEQQQNRIRGIEQRLATAGSMFDPVVNRVFAVGFKDVFMSFRHMFPFCLYDFRFSALASEAAAHATTSRNRHEQRARFFRALSQPVYAYNNSAIVLIGVPSSEMGILKPTVRLMALRPARMHAV
jgi:hypothetical protein